MAHLITWATYPVPARGLGPGQFFVYMAVVYVDGNALDQVALSSPRAATAEAKRLAAVYSELAAERHD